jgi:lysophospholipase L1-like esterase
MQPIIGERTVMAERPTLGPEVEARLDERGGMEKFHRDPAWQQQVEDHFAFNLQRLTDIAKAKRVPLMFVSPVANLEWPPFKPEHGESVTAEQRQQFEQLLAIAGDAAMDADKALAALQQAAQLDPLHSLPHYQLGIRYRDMGRFAEARAELFLAKELDVCPLRITQSLRERLLDAAKQTGTALVDTEELITARSRFGFPDNQWLIDHVHPTVEGHELIAKAIVKKMAKLKFVQPVPDWNRSYALARTEHLARLPFAYFERGRDRLKSEQGWARGMVTREKRMAGAAATQKQTTNDTNPTDDGRGSSSDEHG